jgi:hypothetical protein
MITMNVHDVDRVTARASDFASNTDHNGFTSLTIKLGSDTTPFEVTVFGLTPSHAHRLANAINAIRADVSEEEAA